ncbi:MAG: DMT family transporter [Phycisphaerae bacterium]|nr:DMT family transporter [Phycisphaerae bacterium]
MQKSTLKSDTMLFVASLIWGTAFVAQKNGMDHIGPMTYTGLRFLLGAIVLIPVLLYQSYIKVPPRSTPRYLFLTAPLAGLALFAGASLQQIGLITTTASKAGFITGTYIALVPIISLVLGHKIPKSIWLSCLITFLGMYLLSVKGTLKIVPGDIYVLAGAIFWAIHVQLIGYLVIRTNPWQLAFIQFLTCSILSLIAAVIIEPISIHAISAAAIPIFYGGVFSVGIAFTLQVLSQQTAPPAHAAVIMSLEMPIAAIAGFFFLQETLDTRQITGCLLMLTGVLAVQLANIRARRPRQNQL